jgi:glycerophosphoryl diester phosphodiesterase
MNQVAEWAWPELFVHRCGGALAPENTLAGLEIAARLGCRAVEFDVTLSRDCQPILCHDENLERLTGQSTRVGVTSAEVLMRTDVGKRFHPAFAGERIPSLEQALMRCRALGLAANVEIKPAKGFEVQTGEAVGECLAALPEERRPQVLLSSFSAKALESAALKAEFAARALLAERYNDALLLAGQMFGCVSLNLAAVHLEQLQVRNIRDAGMEVMAYTVNSPAEAERLVRWGVRAIFTDRPDLFMPYNR